MVSLGFFVFGGGIRVWGCGIVGMVWEWLVVFGFFVLVVLGGRGIVGLSGLDFKMWKLDVVFEEILVVVKFNVVLVCWCKEI